MHTEDKSCELMANTVTNSTQDARGDDDQACNNEFPIKHTRTHPVEQETTDYMTQKFINESVANEH
jgi:hypothetical protein